MAKSLKISVLYSKLLNLAEEEALNQPANWEYFNYLNKEKDNFTADTNFSARAELREFLRGANRYADEFDFSEWGAMQIEEINGELFELLS